MGGHRIGFSLHALDVIQERDIATEWVERVVDAPALLVSDLADPCLVHALAPVPEREGRVLRVVYNPMKDPVLVVTAFFDRSMRGRL